MKKILIIIMALTIGTASLAINGYNKNHPTTIIIPGQDKYTDGLSECVYYFIMEEQNGFDEGLTYKVKTVGGIEEGYATSIVDWQQS